MICWYNIIISKKKISECEFINYWNSSAAALPPLFVVSSPSVKNLLSPKKKKT